MKTLLTILLLTSVYAKGQTIKFDANLTNGAMDTTVKCRAHFELRYGQKDNDIDTLVFGKTNLFIMLAGQSGSRDMQTGASEYYNDYPYVYNKDGGRSTKNEQPYTRFVRVYFLDDNRKQIVSCSILQTRKDSKVLAR